MNHGSNHQRPSSRNFMNSRELAKFLGVSPRTLERWRAEGRDLPPTYLLNGPRGAHKYLRSEVWNWIKKHRKQDGTQ